ncbi:MAG: UDP-N-acetylmuramoyl-tripeptide--D-alanyl-D-alanine ligase [Gemmatimonadota bacterium]
MTAFEWSDAEVRRALGLRVELADEAVGFTGVSTDSRSVQDGDLYVALVGDRFDGHDFVAQAVAGGARGAVVSRPAPGDPDVPLYPVDDTLVALGALAAHRRDALQAPVVAITGSSGKTSTKELTSAALSDTLRVHATRGNLNNRIGMPLTLLAAPDDAEAVVLELGTNEPGEIRALAQIARPDVAVITTVGESHLEKLGSLEGVLDEKLDILRYVAEGARCVVGDAPPFLAEGARTLCPRVRVVGWSERADAADRPEDADVDIFGNYTFSWRGHRVNLSMPGRHAVSNALVALAIADLIGVSPKDAARAIASADAGSMRGEMRRIGDLTIIVDCYNANPQSVVAALDVLEGQNNASTRVAVLGSMLELGDTASELHVRVLRDAIARDIDVFALTGAFATAAAEIGVVDDERVVVGPTWEDAWPTLRARLAGTEIVLLKASRGVAMEGLLPLMEAAFAPVEA